MQIFERGINLMHSFGDNVLFIGEEGGKDCCPPSMDIIVCRVPNKCLPDSSLSQASPKFGN